MNQNGDLDSFEQKQILLIIRDSIDNDNALRGFLGEKMNLDVQEIEEALAKIKENRPVIRNLA